ncbi:MAG: uridine kinase [Bacilli bacterium]|nr:uridine kinase [Bacilli bacterium]
MAKIIAISGGSGSGKTFVAKALKENLPGGAVVLSYDNYYRDQGHLKPEERELINYDDPKQLDSELFTKHIQMLREGKAINVPQYDFSTHTRRKVTRPLKSAEWIICEGIMVFQIPLENYDFTIYVHADNDVRLSRRILRDTIMRGRTLDSVISQYMATVKPMHKKYIHPGKGMADFVYVNNDNNGLNTKQFGEMMEAIEKKTK